MICLFVCFLPCTLSLFLFPSFFQYLSFESSSVVVFSLLYCFDVSFSHDLFTECGSSLGRVGRRQPSPTGEQPAHPARSIGLRQANIWPHSRVNFNPVGDGTVKCFLRVGKFRKKPGTSSWALTFASEDMVKRQEAVSKLINSYYDYLGTRNVPAHWMH